MSGDSCLSASNSRDYDANFDRGRGENLGVLKFSLNLGKTTGTLFVICKECYVVYFTTKRRWNRVCAGLFTSNFLADSRGSLPHRTVKLFIWLVSVVLAVVQLAKRDAGNSVA